MQQPHKTVMYMTPTEFRQQVMWAVIGALAMWTAVLALLGVAITLFVFTVAR